MPIILDPLPSAGPVTPPVAEPLALDTVADDYYRRLGPLTIPDPDNGFALMALADALTKPLSLVYQLSQATDEHEPWEIALDPDTAPEEILPWLAQPAGVSLQPSDTIEQQRARIKAASGMFAGSDQSIRDEVSLHSTSRDPARVKVLHPAQWQITVVVRTADTPDPAASERAALCQIPAGSLLTFVVSDYPIWNETTGTWDEVAAGVSWNDATIADVT